MWSSQKVWHGIYVCVTKSSVVYLKKCHGKFNKNVVEWSTQFSCYFKWNYYDSPDPPSTKPPCVGKAHHWVYRRSLAPPLERVLSPPWWSRRQRREEGSERRGACSGGLGCAESPRRSDAGVKTGEAFSSVPLTILQLPESMWVDLVSWRSPRPGSCS